MSQTGLDAAIALMEKDGAPAEAIAVFSHYYAKLESGESGLIHEADIEPVTDLPELDQLDVDPQVAADAFAATAVIKLNGGLATSMGLDQAKSLLPVKDGLTFLDIIVRQVLALREQHDVRLPLVFMNSFRTSDDTLAALAGYPELPTAGLPLDFLQNREPKLLAEDLTPVRMAGRSAAAVVPTRARRPVPGAALVRRAGRAARPGLPLRVLLQLRQPRRRGRTAHRRLDGGQLGPVRVGVHPPHPGRPQGRPPGRAPRRWPADPARDGPDRTRGPGSAAGPRPAPVLQHEQPVDRSARAGASCSTAPTAFSTCR